jgi:hypothetical protein
MDRTMLLRALAALAIAATMACGGSKLGDQPPEFVGSWVSMRNGSLWRIELRENGRFRAKPDDPSAGATTEGEWAVEDGKMLWSYTDSESRIKTVLAGADEKNEIIRLDKDSFELVERNGSRSKFTRARPPGEAAPAPRPAPSIPVPVEPSEPEPMPEPSEPSETLEPSENPE